MSEKKTVKLQEEVLRWETKTAELEQQHQQAAVRAAEIEYERGQHILAALAENDPAAKKQLEKFTVELERAVRHSADLGLAHQQAGERVAALRQELLAAERVVLGAQIEGAITERLKLGAQLESEILRNVIPQLEEIRAVTERLTVFARDLGLNGNFRQHSLGRALGFVVSMIYREFPLQRTILSGGELAWGLDPAVLNKPKPLTTADGEYFGRTREQLRALVAKDPAAIAAE